MAEFSINSFDMYLLWQPKDWDDREYIDDPDATKPEVNLYI